MATQSTYYLNGPSLLSSTAVFTDAPLTTCAADGYYRQGTVVRQMVGCVLLPPQTCPSCVDECGSGIIESLSSPGVYSVSLETGQSVGDVGAIVIRFNPLAAPDGIQVELNGVIYNSLSSPTYGYLAGTANLPTYIGSSTSDCGLVIDSPHILDVYNWYSSNWETPTTTETISITSGQLDLTATSPGQCIMVIPKTVAIPSIIDVKIISPCPTNDFVLEVDCPVTLTALECSEGFAEYELACAVAPSLFFYFVHVNGSGGTLGLYDWVFSDQNGENVLANNYYKSTACPSPNEWFRVEDGVIVEFGTCP